MSRSFKEQAFFWLTRYIVKCLWWNLEYQKIHWWRDAAFDADYATAHRVLNIITVSLEINSISTIKNWYILDKCSSLNLQSSTMAFVYIDICLLRNSFGNEDLWWLLRRNESQYTIQMSSEWIHGHHCSATVLCHMMRYSIIFWIRSLSCTFFSDKFLKRSIVEILCFNIKEKKIH